MREYVNKIEVNGLMVTVRTNVGDGLMDINYNLRAARAMHPMDALGVLLAVCHSICSQSQVDLLEVVRNMVKLEDGLH